MGTNANEVEAVEALSGDDSYELGFAEEGDLGGGQRTRTGGQRSGVGHCVCGGVVPVPAAKLYCWCHIVTRPTPRRRGEALWNVSSK